jgi:GAG-pre-integrase domain
MLIGVVETINGIYYYCSVTQSQAFHVKKSADYRLWHQCMGHPSVQIIILLSGVKSNSSISEGVCEICLQAKQTRENVPISSNKAVESFALIHCVFPFSLLACFEHCNSHSEVKRGATDVHDVGYDDELLRNSSDLVDRGSIEFADVEDQGVLESDVFESNANDQVVTDLLPATESSEPWGTRMTSSSSSS